MLCWLKSVRHRKKLHNNSGDCDRHEASGGRTRKEEEEERDERTKVWHTGSCHCNRFRFRVFAPEDLCVVEYRASSSCKLLRFPRLTLNSCDFEVAAAAENSSLSLYSVVDNFSQQKRQVGIHAFCSFCGMQVFYSPPPPEPLISYRKGGEVVVNVDCLDKGTVNQVHVAYGGIRNMPPHSAQNNVQVPSHQQQDCQHHLSESFRGHVPVYGHEQSSTMHYFSISRETNHFCAVYQYMYNSKFAKFDRRATWSTISSHMSQRKRTSC